MASGGGWEVLVMDYDGVVIQFRVTKDDIQSPALNICIHIWSTSPSRTPPPPS